MRVKNSKGGLEQCLYGFLWVTAHLTVTDSSWWCCQCFFFPSAMEKELHPSWRTQESFLEQMNIPAPWGRCVIRGKGSKEFIGTRYLCSHPPPREKTSWESLRSCLYMAQSHCGLGSFLRAGLRLSKFGLVFVVHPFPDDSSPSIFAPWWQVQAGSWMLADFRSSVEILFLRWENLKPKQRHFPMQGRIKFQSWNFHGDVSWWREPGCTSDSSEVSVRPSWPPHEQGPAALHNDKVCLISVLVSAFYTDNITHSQPGDGTFAWKSLFHDLPQHCSSRSISECAKQLCWRRPRAWPSLG